MRSILHIDNSEVFMNALEDIFTTHGCEYHSATNGMSAFNILKDNNIDLIMSSLELKKESGKELIESIISSEYKDIPIVIFTSNDSLDLRKDMFNLGVIDYIPKNLDHERLNKYIERIIQDDREQPKLQDLSIAVLDDSEIELRIIRHVLDLHDIKNVDYFSNPDELMKSEKEYNIYLVDVILPKHSGDQLIYEIRSKNSRAIIIAISGIENYKTIANVFYSGADDYIMKPFNNSIMMARLNAHVRTFGLLQDIDKKNRELEKMVVTDSLTKLYNHRYIYDRLDQEIKKSDRYGKSLSLLMLDIDDFKQINDTHGHQTGDKVLMAIAKALRSSLREIDIVGRYGGEEFVVILPEASFENAQVVAEKLRKSICALQFKEKDLTVTISGGVAEYKNEDALQLIDRADDLLYKAKNEGKNRIAC